MAHLEDRSPAEFTDPIVASNNARIGLILFAVYSSFYLAFMILNAFVPHVMEFEVIDGLNLAIVFGIGLIISAFFLALFYAWLCRTPAVAEPDL